MPSSPSPLTPSSPSSRLRLQVGFCAWLMMGASLVAQTGAPVDPLETLFKQGAEAYSKNDYATTIARFTQLLKTATPGPALEPVYFTLATARLRMGDTAGAVEAFRTYLQLYPAGAQIADARSGLAQALLKAGRVPEALSILAALQGLGGGTQGLDNHAAVVGIAVEIADQLLASKKAAEALILLQALPDREQIIDRQRRRNQELEQLHRQAVGAAGSFGAETSVAVQRDALATRLADAREVLKRIEANPAFDLPRLLRQARCHLELDQPWEAIVLYQEILARFPTAPDRAYALHGLILARQAAGRAAVAQDLATRFLEEFPSHALAPEVAVIGGQIALDRQLPAAGEGFFGTAIDKSQGLLRERVIFQLGIARFARRDWAGSREMFDRYVREYPKGEWADNAAYRSAVTWFLDDADVNRYAKAEKSITAFVQAHPSSTYLPDAYYRLAVCKFAFQEYEQAVAACTDWEKRFPTDGQLAEVLSLKGDVLKSLNRPDRALETYLRAASAASNDEILSYTLNESARLLEAQKDWARLSALFKTQVDRQPESPLVLGWYYWIARADARAGKTDEAWNFLAEHAAQAFGDASREDIEKMLLLMAQIASRKKPASTEASATVAPDTALRDRLHLADDAPVIAQARLRYYQASLLRLTRKPAEAVRILASLGRELPAAQLSAPILAESGDALLNAGETEKAAEFFKTLLARFPMSEYRDYSYVGLGDLALQRGEAAVALKSYEDAIDVAGAQHRLREATVGKARALFALDRLDEAAKLFESIAAAKEWRGEATALSLHHLGLIAVKRDDLPKGIAFFQRVFVSQGRFPEWVAKSYWACGQAFEKLGKPTEAAATYREMLRNERIRTFPETSLATQRLAALATP